MTHYRRKSPTVKILAALVATVVAAIVVTSAVMIARTGLDQPELTRRPLPVVAPAPGEADGTWHVGFDMPAGTWRTDGAVDSYLPNCYWERASDASGQFAAIIANDISTGPMLVTLTAGDYFTTRGCQPWQLT